MKKVFLMILISGISFNVFAGPKCTDEPKTKWQDEGAFKARLVEEGYKIKVFKTTSGNCYEIYGWDKKSQKVEIYYNPITAKEVKRRTF